MSFIGTGTSPLAQTQRYGDIWKGGNEVPRILFEALMEVRGQRALRKFDP